MAWCTTVFAPGAARRLAPWELAAEAEAAARSRRASSVAACATMRPPASASSRASGLGEGLSNVKSHTTPPDLPGAVGVGESSPPPADVLARRADIDFVQDAQASMHSSCDPPVTFSVSTASPVFPPFRSR